MQIGFRKALLLILPLFVMQIALYHRSFGIKPASDDFPVVHDILRGNQQGPGIFFTRSFTSMHYRPFKALSIWAFGQISDQHREFWIRVLHFLGMTGYLLVLVLWLSRMPLSPLACAIAGVVLLFHPVLPQALGSIDGIDSIASSAFIWLGAWFAFIWRDRVIRATIATAMCFALAAGWKEYSFTIVPLATWTISCFSTRQHRLRNAAIIFAGLCVVFAGVLVVRQHAMPGGFGSLKGTDYVARNPLQWIINAGVIISGLLFFGNSVWVYVHQSPAVLAMVAVCMLIAAALIGIGLVPARKDSHKRTCVIFLLGSFIAASFPQNVIFHVSEMYLTPLLLPLALLCGVAFDGWRVQRKPLRCVACALASAALISSGFTVHAKVNGIRDVGDRAEMQMRQILALLPPDAHDVKVAMVFDLSELPPRRTYAVYRMGDENLVVHSVALDWLAPQRHLELGSFPIDSPDFHPSDWDYIYKWNPREQRFAPLVPSPSGRGFG
jgi:hypothetical protein